MGPKPRAKATPTGATPDGQPDEPRELTLADHVANGSAAFEAAGIGIEAALDGFQRELQSRVLQGMILPFTCEASLSQALEPSLLYHFHADVEELLFESGEDEEPAHIDIDPHCLDKYKGKPSAFKRPALDSLLMVPTEVENNEKKEEEEGKSALSRSSRVSAKNMKGSQR